MKVVWLCHFSNKEIQEIIKPGKPINEIAPWISSLTKLFENGKNIELHIVSPHKYISGIKEFNLRGINYHFYNAHIPIWGRNWPGIFRFDYWTNFYFNNNKVEKIIKGIKPELIHLHGAENAYYSSSILRFTKLYPILVTIQGFISSSTSRGQQTDKRIKIEKEILETFNDFGYRTQTMGNQIKEFNPNARLHWHNYPITIPQLEVTEKKYDIVFFARVSKDKGIEDLLEALSLVKKEIPGLSLCIIGGASSAYYDYLKAKAVQLIIDKNIYWAGFLPTQMNVHEMASSAKICVLPTYHEIIAGTIIESMFLKLPVIAYNVGSIHEVNEKENIIRLVTKGDINKLAEEIKNLLIDEKLLYETAEKGYKRAQEMFNNKDIVADILGAYNEVLSAKSKNQ